jgi:hypothetical protein
MAASTGELWLVGRARLANLADENRLALDALRATENQLEAERIVGAREVGSLRKAAAEVAGFRVLALAAEPPGPASGVALWRSDDPRVVNLHLAGLGELPPGRVYRLWIQRPEPAGPLDCGSFTEAPRMALDLRLASPVGRGCRFVLVSDRADRNDASPADFKAGSIVLASPPIDGSISGR